MEMCFRATMRHMVVLWQSNKYHTCQTTIEAVMMSKQKKIVIMKIILIIIVYIQIVTIVVTAVVFHPKYTENKAITFIIRVHKIEVQLLRCLMQLLLLYSKSKYLNVHVIQI